MKSHVGRNLKKIQQTFAAELRQYTTTTETKTAGLAAVSIEDRHEYPHQYSMLRNIELPNTDVLSYSLRKANQFQNIVALECGISGRQYTHAQMIDGAMRWSAVLDKVLAGQKNKTVAFLTPNTPEFVVLFYGCMANGATVTPINPIYTPQEIAHHLEDSEASMLVVDSMVEPLADVALRHLGKDIPVFVNGKSIHNRPNVMEIIRNSTAPMAEQKEIDPSSIAFLPYSSGTTGKPKGVSLSHRAITNNMALYINDDISSQEYAKDGEKQEVGIGILPFFHIYGMTATLLNCVSYGSKLVTLPVFDPTLFTTTIKKYKPTSLQVVPPLLQFIAGNPHITKDDLSDLKSFIVGAAPVPSTAANAIKQHKAPQAVFQEGYGMTETLLTHITPVKGENIGFCGKLLSNCEAKIIDIESGENMPANESGELCIRTPSMMSGYHNNPKATNETIDEEGWIHTGDVAYFTKDGYYSVVDRIKELIKVKGSQVSPSELEDTLLELPGVQDVGVVGIPNERLGEAPMAYIVKGDKSLSDKDIHTFLHERLAKHKQLVGGIKFVDELPKSATGKLLRRVLKQMSKDDQES